MKNALLVALCFFALIAGCDYRKTTMNVTVKNGSPQTLRNIEVDYPGGIYGVTEMPAQQADTRSIAITGACKFKVAFENMAGKRLEPAKAIDLGSSCPKSVTLTLKDDLTIESVPPSR